MFGLASLLLAWAEALSVVDVPSARGFDRMMRRNSSIAVVLMGASLCFGAGFIEELNSMGKGS
ncbi:MAG: hypothetical protein WCH86_08915, partial [Kiritimatiellales bacterium]